MAAISWNVFWVGAGWVPARARRPRGHRAAQRRQEHNRARRRRARPHAGRWIRPTAAVAERLPRQMSGQPAMSGPVIACLDEGRAGAAAAGVAGSLSRRLGSPLMLATVTAAEAPGVGRQLGPSPVERARSVLLSQGASILADAADGAGPDPELRVELGEPAERLASLAHRTGARLLVLGVPDACCRSWARPRERVHRARGHVALPGGGRPAVDGSSPAQPMRRSCAVSTARTSRWPQRASRSTSDGGSTRPSSSSTSLSDRGCQGAG